jgi:hypothetical protein
VRVDFGGTVCATGDVGLTNVTVTDDHAGLVFSAASLAKGACAPFTRELLPERDREPGSRPCRVLGHGHGEGHFGSGQPDRRGHRYRHLCAVPA